MEKERRGRGFVMSFVLVGLFSHSLIPPVMCRKPGELSDQKTYYSSPHTGSSNKNPDCSTPTHTAPTPSYSAPTPSHGSNGGGYSSPVGQPTPSAPVVQPYIPTIPVTAPSTPATAPSTPTISAPSPWIPVVPHFHYFTGTCDYWRSHPEAIWAIFGYWGTVGQYFGAACGKAFGTNMSLLDALANTRHDVIGALFRQGTASFLNSMVDRNFPFTTQQVKDALAGAVLSDGATAAAQAGVFKRANEGRLNF